MKRKVSDKLYKNLQLYMDTNELLKNYEKGDDTLDDPAIIEYIREYYNKHLPVDVYAWRQVNKFLNRDEEIDEQIDFMLEQIVDKFFLYSKENIARKFLRVLGTHLAMDDAIFPIFELNIEDYYGGFEIIASCMGEKWIASFKFNDELCDFDPMGFYNLGPVSISDSTHLPKDKVYKNFEESKKEFTVKFDSKYDFYAFCMLLREHISL